MKLRKCGERAILGDWMISYFPISMVQSSPLPTSCPFRWRFPFNGTGDELARSPDYHRVCCKVIVIMNVQVLYSILGPVIYQCLLGIVPSGHA